VAIRPNEELGDLGSGQAEPVQEVVVVDPEHAVLRVGAQPAGGDDI
jgi:hypothetical protein